MENAGVSEESRVNVKILSINLKNTGLQTMLKDCLECNVRCASTIGVLCKSGSTL